MKTTHGHVQCAALFVAAVAAAWPTSILAQKQPPRHPFEIPFPSKSPPFLWPNQHNEEVECRDTPWRVVDHCSMPSPDLVSEEYKKVFRRTCDLHDICYFAPGNTKRFCDDMFEWHLHRDCARAYANVLAKKQCDLAAGLWRKGLDNAISDGYWIRSQDWGRRYCRINHAAPDAPRGFAWTRLDGAALPPGVVLTTELGNEAVCRARHEGGVHPGRTHGTRCTIGYGGHEVGIGGVEVLVAKPEKVKWVAAEPTAAPQYAVVAGRAAGQPLFVCRARHVEGLHAGKVHAGHCNVGYNGRELALRPYEVLVDAVPGRAPR